MTSCVAYKDDDSIDMRLLMRSSRASVHDIQKELEAANNARRNKVLTITGSDYNTAGVASINALLEVPHIVCSATRIEHDNDRNLGLSPEMLNAQLDMIAMSGAEVVNHVETIRDNVANMAVDAEQAEPRLSAMDFLTSLIVDAANSNKQAETPTIGAEPEQDQIQTLEDDGVQLETLAGEENGELQDEIPVPDIAELNTVEEGVEIVSEEGMTQNAESENGDVLDIEALPTREDEVALEEQSEILNEDSLTEGVDGNSDGVERFLEAETEIASLDGEDNIVIEDNVVDVEVTEDPDTEALDNPETSDTAHLAIGGESDFHELETDKEIVMDVTDDLMSEATQAQDEIVLVRESDTDIAVDDVVNKDEVVQELFEQEVETSVEDTDFIETVSDNSDGSELEEFQSLDKEGLIEETQAYQDDGASEIENVSALAHQEGGQETERGLQVEGQAVDQVEDAVEDIAAPNFASPEADAPEERLVENISQDATTMNAEAAVPETVTKEGLAGSETPPEAMERQNFDSEALEIKTDDIIRDDAEKDSAGLAALSNDETLETATEIGNNADASADIITDDQKATPKDISLAGDGTDNTEAYPEAVFKDENIALSEVSAEKETADTIEAPGSTEIDGDTINPEPINADNTFDTTKSEPSVTGAQSIDDSVSGASEATDKGIVVEEGLTQETVKDEPNSHSPERTVEQNEAENYQAESREGGEISNTDGEISAPTETEISASPHETARQEIVTETHADTVNHSQDAIDETVNGADSHAPITDTQSKEENGLEHVKTQAVEVTHQEEGVTEISREGVRADAPADGVESQGSAVIPTEVDQGFYTVDSKETVEVTERAPVENGSTPANDAGGEAPLTTTEAPKHDAEVTSSSLQSDIIGADAPEIRESHTESIGNASDIESFAPLSTELGTPQARDAEEAILKSPEPAPIKDIDIKLAEDVSQTTEAVEAQGDIVVTDAADSISVSRTEAPADFDKYDISGGQTFSYENSRETATGGDSLSTSRRDSTSIELNSNQPTSERAEEGFAQAPDKATEQLGASTDASLEQSAPEMSADTNRVNLSGDYDSPSIPQTGNEEVITHIPSNAPEDGGRRVETPTEQAVSPTMQPPETTAPTVERAEVTTPQQPLTPTSETADIGSSDSAHSQSATLDTPARNGDIQSHNQPSTPEGGEPTIETPTEQSGQAEPQLLETTTPPIVERGDTIIAEQSAPQKTQTPLPPEQSQAERGASLLQQNVADETIAKSPDAPDTQKHGSGCQCGACQPFNTASGADSPNADKTFKTDLAIDLGDNTSGSPSHDENSHEQSNTRKSNGNSQPKPSESIQADIHKNSSANVRIDPSIATADSQVDKGLSENVNQNDQHGAGCQCGACQPFNKASGSNPSFQSDIKVDIGSDITKPNEQASKSATVADVVTDNQGKHNEYVKKDDWGLGEFIRDAQEKQLGENAQAQQTPNGGPCSSCFTKACSSCGVAAAAAAEVEKPKPRGKSLV